MNERGDGAPLPTGSRVSEKPDATPAGCVRSPDGCSSARSLKLSKYWKRISGGSTR
jgi:hypothetical protein